MNELRSWRFWLSLAVVVLGAIGSTWPGKPIAALCANLVTGLGALGITVGQVQVYGEARRAAALTEKKPKKE